MREFNMKNDMGHTSHWRQALASRYASAVLVIALSVLGALLAVGCNIGLDVTTDGLFSCNSDEDCVEGFYCLREAGETVGTCRTGGEENQYCHDYDRDGYLGGEGCEQPLGFFDCNDDPDTGVLVNPSRPELCNGADDDCDGSTDEDIADRPCAFQAGVCDGAMQSCVDGGWIDCEAAGLYGPHYENVAQNDESCDGLDNNCSGGYSADATADEIDPHCSCLPGVTPPRECGRNIGVCERGIQFCLGDGSWTPCFMASLGDDCDDQDDCGTNEYCVLETLDVREDFYDDCRIGSEPGCEQRVCRVLVPAGSCETADCAAGQECYDGECFHTATTDSSETCNGLDDNCNGRMDENGICGQCGYNQAFIASVPGNPLGLCIDMYEASRPDATSTNAGSSELYAATEPDTLPWTGVADTLAADNACRGGEINEYLPGAVPMKRLCTRDELRAACGALCTAGGCAAGVCNDSTTGSAVSSSGSYSDCCTGQGVCDLAGNAAELFASPYQGLSGGSTAESGEDVSCTAENMLSPLPIPAADVGFRCCSAPSN